MLDMRLAKLLSDYLGQWIIDGLEDIRHGESGGVKLISGSHAREQGDIHIMTTIDQIELSSDGINAVHNVIVVGKVELISVTRQIERLIFAHDATWIDIMNTCFGNIHLMFAYGRECG